MAGSTAVVKAALMVVSTVVSKAGSTAGCWVGLSAISMVSPMAARMVDSMAVLWVFGTAASMGQWLGTWSAVLSVIVRVVRTADGLARGSAGHWDASWAGQKAAELVSSTADYWVDKLVE